MSIPNPNVEPATIDKGLTLQWTRLFPEYRAAAGWQLAYYLKGPSAITLNWGAEVTAGGEDFQILVPATTTAGWAVGNFWWSAIVVNGALKAQAASGLLEIQPDPLAVSVPYDGRTHAHKMLDLIKATLEGTATREERQLAISFGGTTRQIEFFSREDLTKMLTYYQALRNAEIAAENVAAGQASGRRILNRYVTPS